jgi:hypothetical protein
MQDGVVTIEVLEGKLEGVRIDNASRLSTEAVQSRLSSVKAGDVFNKSSSERALLLLSDTPGAGGGFAFCSGHSAGRKCAGDPPGGAPLIAGRVEADNHGGLWHGSQQAWCVRRSQQCAGFGRAFFGQGAGERCGALQRAPGCPVSLLAVMG